MLHRVSHSILRFALIIAVSVAALASAAELPKVDEKTEKLIQQSLSKLTSGAPLGPIHPSPIEGLYAVQIIGGPALLVSADAKHVIMGDLYDLTDSGLSPVQDPYMLASRKAFVDSLSLDETINFVPEVMTKAVAYVFTDIDCGYCRKLHSQMHTYNDMGTVKPGFNELGIEIRYLAYPRSGLINPKTGEKTGSLVKLESAWCAKNKQAALSDLKAGGVVKPLTCDANPVARHYTKGGEIGINATPAILLPDGRMFLGYKSPEDLLKTITTASETGS